MRETAGIGTGQGAGAVPGGAVPSGAVPDGAGPAVGTAPAGDVRAGAVGERGTETFRSPIALLVWWVWLAFAVANLIDLAVQGSGRASAVAAAVLILVTGVVYVAALRPRVVADDEGIVVRNPLRDHRVGWPAVSGVDIADLLRVHCSWPDTTGRADGGVRRKVIHAWAVQSSRRSRAAA